MNYADALVLFIGGLIVGALVSGWLLIGVCEVILHKARRTLERSEVMCKRADALHQQAIETVACAHLIADLKPELNP